MNAKDLRVGNLTYYHIIDNLDERQEWNELNIIDYDDLRILTEYPNDSDEYRGLPITPQLLLSHSFKQDTDNIWYDFQDGSYLELREVKDGWHVTIGDSPEMSCDEEQRIGITTIQYFHQLQNLIYDMKGIEI